MADPIKLELKEANLTAWTNTLKELKDFKKDFEGKLLEAKNKKTLEEAKVLFPDVIFLYDKNDRILQIGDVTMQASSPEQWNEWMNKMAIDIAALNTELAGLEAQMKAEQDKALEIEKDKQKKLADEVKDNTSTEIDFSQKIKEKSWLSTFLTGTTTLEQAIDDKNDVELEAFRKTLLEALKKGQSEYEKVLKNWGAATFNQKEWYALQFIEKNKDALSKKDKKIDWRAMKIEFNKWLDANGEPIEKQVWPGKTPAEKTNTTVEKTYEQMTDAEKITKAQEAMQILASVQMISERNRVTGKQENVVNLTAIQITAIETLSQLGGADFGYDAVWYEPSRLDKQNDRLVEKTQNLMNRGKLKKSLKFAEKANDKFTDQRKTLQKINAFSQNFANERNRAAYNKNVANNAMNLAKWPGYAGVTMDVIPYAPLFKNICQNVRALSDRGHMTMDVIWIGPVQVRSPERYNLAFGNAFNGVAGQYGLDGQYALTGQNSNGRGINQLESFITKNTRMNPEQAKGLTNGLLLGGWAFLLFKSMKWLFTGEWKSKKAMKDTFWGRAAMIGWGLWGVNKLSQLGTWQWVGDVLKWLYTGKMTFQDLWKGTYAKYPPNSPEYLAWTNETYNQAFRNVPYSALLPYLEKWTNWYPKFKDISGFILQLKIIESQTTDANQKAAIRSQITFLEWLSKDPNGVNILNQAFINMWLDYDKMKKTPDANANSLSNEISERIKKYSDYLVEKGLQIKEWVKNATDKLLEYIKTWKPTLEDMEKDGCFEKKNTPPSESSDPFVKIDKDGNKIEVDPKTVPWFDEALWTIDLPLAKTLHAAKMKLAKNSIDVKFETDKATWVLLLHSVEMLTPIMFVNGGWYVGWESSGNGTDRFPTRFENAENALWVAHLTNRLIHIYTGKYSSINKPFSASGEYRDLMVGGSGTLLQRFTDTEAIDSWTAKSLGWKEFSRNIVGYANYLNGIHNKNGESIWNEKGKVWYNLRSTYFENWLKGAIPLPKLKKEDEFDPNKKTPDTPNNPDNKKTTPDVNDKKNVLNDKDPEFTDADKTLGDKWYEDYKHKDGGDATGKNPLERNKTFFYIWAKAFRTNMPYFTVDAYGMIGTNKWKELGIIYKRQVNQWWNKKDDAPRRIEVKQWLYGHKDKVNEKPQ